MQGSRAAGGGKRRKASLILGGIALVGIAAIGVWWTAAMRTPTIDIPNPKMPNPNAFDLYLAAGKAIASSKQFNDALSTKPSVTYTQAQKEAILKQNAGVFQSVQQAFSAQYLNPPDRTMGKLFPEYAIFRDLERLLAFQAMVRSEEGNWSGAANSCLDGMRFGQDIPRGANMIGSLVGMACQAIARQRMWKIVDHLNAPQTQAAIDRLETILAHPVSYADTLQEEKWAGQAHLLAMFGDKRYVAARSPAAPGTPGAGALESLSYLFHSKQRILSEYTNYMDAIIAQARQPYAAKLPLPPLPRDPLSRLSVEVEMEGRIKAVDTETQNGLLLVTLALHAYHLEKGRYPATLAELTPAYLKKLPDDPFAMQGALLYHPQRQGYVLYSVGPDGKDDGGAAIDDPRMASSTNSNTRYYVQKDSYGDVVAGKNF